MAVLSDSAAIAGRVPQVADNASQRTKQAQDRQLARWGGIAGMVGALLLVVSAVVVTAMGLPDASDVETLQDFANIETGRIIEHFLYLGALMGMALHVFALYRLLKKPHRPAALFAKAMAAFGLVIMAASSVLHVSTAALADLYNAPDASPQDLRAIEYAWYGAQSVFDTMLATGALLVPIGMILFGVAMWKAPGFGSRFGGLGVGLGLIGVIGATIGIIDPGSPALAASVLAMAVFHLGTGWRTYKLPDNTSVDLTRSAVG